jgi:hypothetical protein
MLHLFKVGETKKGVTSLVSIHEYLQFDKTTVGDNIIQDLDNRINYYNMLGIEYTVNKGTLKIDSCKSEQNDIVLYITEYGNPSALIEKVTVNLKKKTSIKLSTKQQVSVWA